MAVLTSSLFSGAMANKTELIFLVWQVNEVKAPIKNEMIAAGDAILYSGAPGVPAGSLPWATCSRLTCAIFVFASFFQPTTK